MVINKLHRIKIALSSWLLFAFAGVFVCGILCDTGIVDIRMHTAFRDGQSHKHENHHDHFWAVSTGEMADHHDAKHADKQHPHHQHDQSDECCDEEREEWFATIVKPKLPEFQVVKVPILLMEVRLPDTFSIVHLIIERPYEFRCALSPPGYLIRILFQSFLC